ncbi:MAG: uridine kinase [Saprospiraceae bacterium]|nr:uridine kinase [Candidatus Vicinibacter affinis]
MSDRQSILIGISGGSGSGKTAFINALWTVFKPEELGLISEDNYYKPREQQQKDERGVINFDIPDAIDQDAFVGDLHRLLKQEPVSRKEYVFNNDLALAGDIQIVPARIYIVEGLFIFYREEVRKLLDLKVLIHAKDELRIIRRIKRDQAERNYPLEDVLYRYQHHVAPAYELYIQPFQEDLDLIINNNLHFNKGVDLMTAYLRSILDKP